MSVSEIKFHDVSIANIPFVTMPLLKLHGRIVSTFEPLDAKKPMWDIAKRIITLCSALFVYPALGILALISFIASKLESVNPLYHETKSALDDLQSAFKSTTTIAKKHWSLCETKISLENSESGTSETLDGIGSGKEHYYASFDNIKSLTMAGLGKYKSQNFKLRFKFIVVEPLSKSTFEVRFCDLMVQPGIDKLNRDFNSKTGSIDEITSFLLEMGIKSKCPFEKLKFKC